ncbi:MAG: tetratricopeptide repeat protein [Magnetococcales bacterium]|nr:tetratricopeptide repeat protein [Magnetococcales bacterium]
MRTTHQQGRSRSTDTPDSWFAYGVRLAGAGQDAQAEAAFCRVLELLPECFEALSQLTLLARRQGRHADAGRFAARGVDAHPERAEAWLNLGAVLMDENEHERAERLLRQALGRWPERADIHFNLGLILQKERRDAEAEEAYRQAVRCGCGSAGAGNNLGVLLKARGALAEAESVWREVARCHPGHAETWYNLGNLRREMARPDEAEAAYRHTLTLHPGHADALNNLGTLLLEQGDPDGAEAAYREALRQRADFADAARNLAVLLLSLGRFAEGWPLHEARLHPNNRHRRSMRCIPPDLPFPQWRGEDLAGRSLLVVPEQGYGDQMQFCRYLPLLKGRGAGTITLLCDPPLLALLTGLDGVDRLLSTEAVLATGYPRHDFWVFLLSLPMHCATTLETIPADLPCLRVPEERLAFWGQRLPEPGDGLRVGLVWKGNPRNLHDGWRSLPGMATLAPLWRVRDVTFVALQKGAGEEEAAHPPPEQPLWWPGETVQDFADTGAIVAHLDLVISVDSAVAHLAGGLGVPCWLLLAARGTDWRWLRDREDSPWYPETMRLFRQTRPGDWKEVAERVTMCLLQAVMERRFEQLAALLESGRLAEAEGVARRLVALAPGEARNHHNLGVILRGLGRSGEAEEALRQAVALDPGFAPGWNELGRSLLERRRWEEAAACLAGVSDAVSCNLRGVALMRLERPGEAEACFRDALRLRPDLVEAMTNLALSLAARNLDEEADAWHQAALTQEPERAELHFNRGVLLEKGQRWREAEAAYRQAVRLRPDYAEGWENLGNLLKGSDRIREAEAALREALRLRPDHADTRWNLALFNLSLGRLEPAWPLYEARMHPGCSMRRAMGTVPVEAPFPLWRGEDLTGKSLLVLPEQGYGDQIQFCRYLPLLRTRGVAHVTVACLAPLTALFAGLEGVDQVMEVDDVGKESPWHDYWIFLLSLPHRFATSLTTLPASIPYLRAPPERLALWGDRLAALPDGLRVGLVWRGNPENPLDAHRSLPDPQLLAPLWRIRGAVFVDLQREETTRLPSGLFLAHPGGAIRDFADTAAILAHLDLLITVDSALAFLAGALGKRCWVMLPARHANPIWMRDREESPWYPGVVRLFRQEHPGEWNGVVERVAEALAERCG